VLCHSVVSLVNLVASKNIQRLKGHGWVEQEHDAQHRYADRSFDVKLPFSGPKNGFEDEQSCSNDHYQYEGQKEIKKQLEN